MMSKRKAPMKALTPVSRDPKARLLMLSASTLRSHLISLIAMRIRRIPTTVKTRAQSPPNCLGVMIVPSRGSRAGGNAFALQSIL